MYEASMRSLLGVKDASDPRFYPPHLGPPRRLPISVGIAILHTVLWLYYPLIHTKIWEKRYVQQVVLRLGTEKYHLERVTR